MGAKKPHKPKRAKKELDHLEALSRLSEADARKAVEKLILQGKPREAIQALQKVPFKENPAFNLPRARAYGSRARQLQEKGLEQEATALLDILSAQLSQAELFTCQDIALVLADAPFYYALRYYLEHRKQHPSCPWVEKSLADQLVLTSGWGSLHEIPDDTPFKADALTMAEAAADLSAARWQEGLLKLDPLSRKSPFASWKLFCKAMVSAYRGEEEDLQRALRQIPEEFPLKKTVEILRRDGSRGLAVLRDRVIKPDKDMAQGLLKSIQSKDKNLPNLITEFAQRVFPQQYDIAVHFLSEAAASVFMRKGIDYQIISKFLPQHFAKYLLIRLELFHGLNLDQKYLPFCLALQYLEGVDVEFPKIGARESVEAAVYMNLLTRALAGRTSLSMLHSRDRSCLLQWLGNPAVKGEDLFIALLDKITRLAPGVLNYYKVLRAFDPAQLSAGGKDILEKILLRMQKLFPEDPFSYLELARVYWSRGAYRKSQKVLEEASKQAPYDPLVREYLGLGLLRAAIRSRGRRSYDIARKDLQAARDLNIKQLFPLIDAIRVATNYLEDGDENRSLTSLGAIPEPVARFRSMACFYQDLMRLDDPGVDKLAGAVQTRVHVDLKAGLKQLSESELSEIIAPLPPELSYLMGRFDPIGFFEPLWPNILEKLNDQHALDIYARLLGYDREGVLAKWVKKDIKARLRRQKGNIFLRFYNALADYLLHPEEGSDAFYDLMKSLDEEETRKLRDFSSRIASNFREPLLSALTYFDFNRLDGPFGFDPGWWPGFDEEDEWEDEWNEEDEWDMADTVGTLMEGLKKAGGEKGLLQFIFEMLAAEAMAAGVDDDALRAIGYELEAKGKGFVRTLRGIYSGKNARRLNRAGRLILFPDQK